MYNDIRLRPCPTPPPKVDLLQALIEYEKFSNKQFAVGGLESLNGKNVPDKKWMLDVLSTVTPNH